jgi:hypothetical protein
MVWVRMTAGSWTRAVVHAIGGALGASSAMIANPTGTRIERGARGELCTGTTVWEFVVATECLPGETLELSLGAGQPYDEAEHGKLRTG